MSVLDLLGRAFLSSSSFLRLKVLFLAFVKSLLDVHRRSYRLSLKKKIDVCSLKKRKFYLEKRKF